MSVPRLSWAGLSEDRGGSWTEPRLHVNISAPLLSCALSVLSILLEMMVVLLHLGFVTVVTDAVSGGGGESCVFIRANCTDI